MILISFFFAIVSISFWSFIPPSPISLNPPEIIVTDFIPFFAQSSIAVGTYFAGTIIVAASTGSSTSVTDLKTGYPNISPPFGFIRYVFPSKLLIKFSAIT
jgi:hypothetical protein